MTRFDRLLLMIDITQHAQVIVEGGEHGIQRGRLALGCIEPCLGGVDFPRAGAPDAGFDQGLSRWLCASRLFAFAQ